MARVAASQTANEETASIRLNEKVLALSASQKSVSGCRSCSTHSAVREFSSATFLSLAGAFANPSNRRPPENSPPTIPALCGKPCSTACRSPPRYRAPSNRYSFRQIVEARQDSGSARTFSSPAAVPKEPVPKFSMGLLQWLYSSPHDSWAPQIERPFAVGPFLCRTVVDDFNRR
jgi:hypothetical protein